MREEHLRAIEKEVKDFFEKTTFNAEIEVSLRDDSFFIDVKTDDPKVLIGEKGQTLLEIQHLLRILLRKKLKESLLVEMDINNYKKRKEEALRDVAKDIANEVSISKREKVLPPMTSYERRIIHLVLKDRSDVTTESINEGSDRRVVVKPKNLIYPA